MIFNNFSESDANIDERIFSRYHNVVVLFVSLFIFLDLSNLFLSSSLRIIP
jgi:hypothetical protein